IFQKNYRMQLMHTAAEQPTENAATTTQSAQTHIQTTSGPASGHLQELQVPIVYGNGWNRAWATLLGLLKFLAADEQAKRRELLPCARELIDLLNFYISFGTLL